MPKKPTYKDLEQRIAELESELDKQRRTRFDALTSYRPVSTDPGTYFLSSIINNTRIVAYAKDTNGRFLLVNTCFCDIFELRKEDVLGKTPFELFPHDIAIQHLEHDRQVIASKTSLVFTEQAMLADGRHEYISVKFPIVDDAGAIIAISGISTDITERARTEEMLRISEERFRLAFHTSPDAINLNRFSDGRFIDVNQGFTDLMGFTREEVIGKSSLDLNIWENPDDRKRLAKGLMETGFVENLEARFVRKSGEVGVGLMSARIMRVNDEDVILSITRDITEIILAQEALRQSESRFRKIVNGSPTGIHLYELLQDGRLVFIGANEAADRLLGVNHQQFMGKTIEEAFPGLKDTEVPARYRQAAESGTIWRTEHIQYEDGLISGAFEVVAFQTEPRKMAALFNEISARKKAELALKESEQRLAAFLENSPDAFFVHDLNGNILQVNAAACRNLGYSHDELIGMSVMDIEQTIQPEESPRIWHKIVSGSVVTLEGRHRRKDGSSFPVEVTISSIRLNNENLLFGFVKDLTERKQMEKEKELYQSKLIQAQKMEALGTLAGGIAHDFNNLLMGIQGRASIISLDLEPTHPCSEHVNAILEYSRSAADLTKQLLGIGRGGKYEVSPFDMNDVVHASATMFGRTKKQIRIHQNLCSPAPVISADRRQIEQVLLNLYVNAWQAMPEGGELYLETAVVNLDAAYCRPYEVAPGPYAKFSVTDTGVGMNQETRQRIFDPFFTTKEIGRGTGLGLASVYGILNNHGGFVTVYSEVGKGATFNIYLPVSKEKAKKSDTRDDKLAKGSETILLVDDEKMIIDVGKVMLKKLGYNVVCALGGRQAVEIVSKESEDIHLVILDMIMPDLSGEKVFDAISKTRPTVPVILSSGYSLNGDAHKIIKKGCAGFIQKPFNLAELSKKVRSILDQGK